MEASSVHRRAVALRYRDFRLLWLGQFVSTVGSQMFVAVGYQLYDITRSPLSLGLLGMVGLVGPSRIYQGHHWPTDVAASYLLGTTYLIALMALYRRAKGRFG